MKKIKSKNWKILLSSLGAVTLLTPVIALSAVACTSENQNNVVPKININTESAANKTIFLNQTQNLPTFSVSARTNTKNGDLIYQWYSSTDNSTTSGTAIEGATQAAYTIPENDALKVGLKYFYVVVSLKNNGNILTSNISETYTLTVIDKIPSITILTQPTNQTATINQTTNLPTFSAIVKNIEGAQLKYQWYSNTTNSNTNGTIIDGATGSSYTVTPTNVSATGVTYFYVIISGTVNGIKLTSVTSDVVTLTVKAVPTITIATQPTNQNTTVGTTTALPTFSVAVEPIEGAAFTYQWYSNTSNSTTGGTIIEGATNASYTIPTSNTQNPGYKYFYVEISGAINGSKLETVTSNQATLTIGYNNTSDATVALNTWLSSQANQKTLLESYLKSQSNGLWILNGSSLWRYKFTTIPNININSLEFIDKNSENQLAFSAWQIKATLTAASTYETWNSTSNVYENPVQIPVGATVELYLPLNFIENQVITSSVTISRTLTVSNDSSSLSFATNSASTNIPSSETSPVYAVKFMSSSGSTLLSGTYQFPAFPTFNNTNSNLPAYPIFSSSSSK